MNTLLALTFVVLMQAQPSIPIQPRVQAPAPAPDPVATANKVITDPTFQANFSKLVIGTTGDLATDFDNGMFGLLNTAWGLPGAIFHRDLSGDQRIVQLNTGLIGLLSGFMIVAMGVAAASNVLAVRRGQVPSMGGAIVGFASVTVALVLAVSSIDVLQLPMDAANLIFDTIGSTTIKDYAEPGLKIAATPFPIGGIVLAFVFFAVMAFLTFVFYKELAWCGTLLATSAMWLFAWLLPWSVPSSLGSGLGMKFIGTVFSPALALAALRLAAPKFADFTTDVALDQLGRILFAMVAYEAPGVIAGAIAVKFPAFGDAYLAGRSVGLFRAGPRPSGGAGAPPADSGNAEAASAPRPSSPGSGGSVTQKAAGFLPGGKA